MSLPIAVLNDCVFRIRLNLPYHYLPTYLTLVKYLELVTNLDQSSVVGIDLGGLTWRRVVVMVIRI